MKKLMLALAIVCATAFVNAAAVGWSLAGASNFASDQYYFFIVGEKGASISAVQTALDAGTDVSSMAIGSGVVGSTGSATVTAASSGKSITTTGSLTGFFVLFDSATPASGTSKYALVSGAGTLTKTVAPTTADVLFASGNQATFLNNSDNWKSFGPSTPPGPGPEPEPGTPEPTSGLLLLVGGAVLGLRRKQK